MKRLLWSVGIGILAGVLDVIPMIAQGLPSSATVSAFVHWIALGVIISYVQMPFRSWVKGLVVAELATLSILALVASSDPVSVPIIFTTTAVLGSLVGWLTSKIK